MENFSDFLQFLGVDNSANILSCLDDPADIIRASSVSRSWHQFVIENGFCKRLCLRLFPEVSSATHDIEVDDKILPMSFGSRCNYKVLDNARRDHIVYAILARGLSPKLRKDCILKAISASTTDNYEVESIDNTLDPFEFADQRLSYWSSKGKSDDDNAPETLQYKLISDLCFITAINIRPFQAYFQDDSPIYSAKSVRFRIGNDDNNWTYVSPEFPMTQVNCLQKFELPEPVLCIGGILQIELSGGVERQGSDGLFYICVTHVQVVGRTLIPSFDVHCHCPGRCEVNYKGLRYEEPRYVPRGYGDNAAEILWKRCHDQAGQLDMFCSQLDNTMGNSIHFLKNVARELRSPIPNAQWPLTQSEGNVRTRVVNWPTHREEQAPYIPEFVEDEQERANDMDFLNMDGTYNTPFSACEVGSSSHTPVPNTPVPNIPWHAPDEPTQEDMQPRRSRRDVHHIHTNILLCPYCSVHRRCPTHGP